MITYRVHHKVSIPATSSSSSLLSHTISTFSMETNKLIFVSAEPSIMCISFTYEYKQCTLFLHSPVHIMRSSLCCSWFLHTPGNTLISIWNEWMKKKTQIFSNCTFVTLVILILPFFSFQIIYSNDFCLSHISNGRTFH